MFIWYILIVFKQLCKHFLNDPFLIPRTYKTNLLTKTANLEKGITWATQGVCQLGKNLMYMLYIFPKFINNTTIIIFSSLLKESEILKWLLWFMSEVCTIPHKYVNFSENSSHPLLLTGFCHKKDLYTSPCQISTLFSNPK